MVKSFKNIAFVIALCCTSFVFASVKDTSISNELIHISGAVYNTNGDALADVQIALPLSQIITTSQPNGHFELYFSDDKREAIVFYKFGFKPLTLSPDSVNGKPLTVKLIPLSVDLKGINIESKANFYTNHLRDVEGVKIYTGKKNDLIKLEKINANLATASARQIYARISGLNIWESDANGNQLEIGGRGLDPSRSANFNVRQNGYDISADALGYPESYYTPSPLAVKQIEVLRGASALQYGSQFGGLINFDLLNDPTEKLNGKIHQSIGSFNLSNTYIELGTKQKNLSAKGYVQYKTGDGFIERSEFESLHSFAQVKYKLSQKITLSAEFTKMASLAQQPGGLTDTQFKENAYQATRFGNWFKVDWNLPSVKLEYKINQNFSSEITYFALLAKREALGYLRAPNRIDPILLNNASYAERQRDLLSDKFVNQGLEIRNLYRYTFNEKPAAIAFGIRAFNGTSKKQQSNATPGSSANFNPDFSQEDPIRLAYDFNNYNVALYAENTLNLGDWKVAPGIRYEFIETQLDGYFTETVRDQSGNALQQTTTSESAKRPRQFAIFGIGTSRRINSLEFYSNFSQNYRSVTFNDFKIDNPSYRVDPNLKDERGFNFDAGVRGVKGNKWRYDANVFYLRYANRIGFSTQVDSNTFRVFQYRTNIGVSNTIGIESLVEYFALSNTKNELKFSLNTSVQRGRYAKNNNPFIAGNKVELIPDVTLKVSADYRYKKFSTNILFTLVDDHFSDATNAFSTPDGISGVIPRYSVLDINFKYQSTKWEVGTGVNNALNSTYFTRRASGYPGPGIITAQPRNLFLSLAYKF